MWHGNKPSELNGVLDKGEESGGVRGGFMLGTGVYINQVVWGNQVACVATIH